MPRKVKKPTKKVAAVRSTRTTRKTQKAPARRAVLQKASNSSFWTESYSSFLLGVVVVIVAVLFVVTLIRQQHSAVQDTSSLATSPAPTTAPAAPTPGTTVEENGQTYYIVKKDDSLWNIAENVYKDGYKWVDIARANNLANPGLIFTGDKLLVPNAPTPSELGQLIQKDNGTQSGTTVTQANPNAISGDSYTVQKGDSLWDIAVRAYADGYQWPKIATANHLANPGLIFSGNVLTIPR